MKITFICGSLNPGHDGVGDYTRALAQKLSQSGHQCQLVAINDSEDSNDVTDHLQILRNTQVLNNPGKSAAVSNSITNWKPDWISLQFVCFGFHPKGFIHKLSPFIQDVRRASKLHIMFHELWVGEQPSLPFKHKVMGLIQRHLMLKALKLWHSDRIHTSNLLYQFILKQHNYASTILPLFSNIPITGKPDTSSPSDENLRTLLFPFSQRHDWNVQETLEQLDSLSKKAGVSLRLIQIGKLHAGNPHWPQIQTFCASRNWSCERLGPQDEATLSKYMHAADIGISSAHIALAGKSGAVAAMTEHGLPVICTITEPISKRFKPAANASNQLYSFFDSEERLIQLFREPARESANPQLPTVADQFIHDLNHTA